MTDRLRTFYWSAPWLRWLRGLSLFFRIVWRPYESCRIPFATAWWVAWWIHRGAPLKGRQWVDGQWVDSKCRAHLLGHPGRGEFLDIDEDIA